VAFTPARSPFWITDNATGCALQVSIPLPGGAVPPTDCKPVNPIATSTPAAPTGIIWNPTTNPATAFLVPGTTLPASFIFDTEDGTISAWTSPATSASLAVDNSAGGAVYKDLAFAVNENGDFLYATNFRAGTIDGSTTTTSRRRRMVGLSILISPPGLRRSTSRKSTACCS
jgi:hypothetical protein